MDNDVLIGTFFPRLRATEAARFFGGHSKDQSKFQGWDLEIGRIPFVGYGDIYIHISYIHIIYIYTHIYIYMMGV